MRRSIGTPRKRTLVGTKYGCRGARYKHPDLAAPPVIASGLGALSSRTASPTEPWGTHGIITGSPSRERIHARQPPGVIADSFRDQIDPLVCALCRLDRDLGR